MTNIVIIAILFVYMVYSIYKAFVVFRRHSAALKEFKADHADARFFDVSKGWVISSVVMGILCIVIAYVMPNMQVDSEKVTAYRALYVIIALIFASMIFTSLAGKRMWFTDDGFFYGERFFKYKDVDRREPIGGVGSNSLRLIMKDSYAITLNKKMNEKVDSEMKLWKTKKKLRK